MSEDRLEVADVFRQHEKEFFRQWGHTLDVHQRRAFRDIRACRTAALGAHLEQCDTCPQQAIAYNSCRNRNCPKCLSTARDKWLAARSAELLPVPYCHVVFTLPQELSMLALQNQRLLYNILFRAVSETLLTIAADPRLKGYGRSASALRPDCTAPTALPRTRCSKRSCSERGPRRISARASRRALDAAHRLPPSASRHRHRRIFCAMR